MWKYVLFDLDGTITDPKVGITKSVQYSLKHFGIEVNDIDTLCTFIGPPLRQSYKDFFGFDDEQAEEAVRVYREYYQDIGIFENEVYEGIPALFAKLKEKGCDIIVATSKPTVFANKIFEYFKLDKYFTYVSGCGLDGSGEKKSDVIRNAIKSCDIKDLSEAIMIGDRDYDVNGAKEVGVKCIGVTYGYGSKEELEAAGADYIVDSVGELTDFCMSITF